MDSDVIKFRPQNLREWARNNGELIMRAEKRTAEELSRTNPKVDDTFGQEAKKIAEAILPNGESSSFISRAIANARKVLGNTEEKVVNLAEAVTKDGSPLNQIAAGRLDAILASAITYLNERSRNALAEIGKQTKRKFITIDELLGVKKNGQEDLPNQKFREFINLAILNYEDPKMQVNYTPFEDERYDLAEIPNAVNSQIEPPVTEEEPPVTEAEVAKTAIASMETAERLSLEGLNHLIKQGEDVPALLRALARAKTTMYLKQEAKS